MDYRSAGRALKATLLAMVSNVVLSSWKPGNRGIIVFGRFVKAEGQVVVGSYPLGGIDGTGLQKR